MTEEWTPHQRQQVYAMYDMLAASLPEKGRDYVVDFSFERADGLVSFSMKPLTPLGTLWCEYFMGLVKERSHGKEKRGVAAQGEPGDMPPPQPVY